MTLYTNLKGTINLNQDNKYKFNISNDNYKGKKKYRCIEYKNSTLKNNEKCLAYFVSENDIFTNYCNPHHSNNKYYTIELERNQTLKYVKEEISKSPNKYALNPKMIYNQVKANHPNISTNFNSLKQNIYNYIKKEKEPEAKSFDAMNWEHPFFTNLNGENLLISHSNYGFIFQNRHKAELCSLYPDRFFFR